MSADKLDKNKFDEILESALQSHSEPVPADFTERMLSRIEEAQEQKILARVVLQERLALGGCIVLGIAAVIMTVVCSDAIIAVFKSVAINLTEQEQAFIDGVPRYIGAVKGNWQLYTVFAVVFGFVFCGLLDLLKANGE